jgi:hypothetical protein
MGTLFNQKPRYENESYAVNRIDSIKKIAKKKGLTIEETIMCLDYAMREHDMDVKDEQLAGFGELLKELNESIVSLGEQIKEGLSEISK